MTVRAGTGRGFVETLERLAGSQGSPVAAMLQLTARCNLACRHCYQVVRRTRELTTRRWVRVLGDLADAGVLFVTLSGGEPLLRRDFFDIAAAARARRFALQVKTNGQRIDRRAADRIARLGVLDVQMSLYSTRPAVHDAVTGLAGSHRRLVAAARMLARRGVQVTMMIPLMSVNAHEVDDLVDACESRGFLWSMDPQIVACEDGSCAPLALAMSPEEAACATPAGSAA